MLHVSTRSIYAIYLLEVRGEANQIKTSIKKKIPKKCAMNNFLLLTCILVIMHRPLVLNICTIYMNST